MNNKKICILGATSDVGSKLAYTFAPEAEHLILTSRNTDRLEALKKDLLIKELYQSVELIDLDACNFEVSTIETLAKETNILISTIGYLGDQKEAEKDPTASRQIIDSNFTGLVSIFEIFAREMEAQEAGTIIGLSSVAGIRGRQSNYLYGSAKAGFTAYLSGLRNRLFTKKVHVMTVLPGFMDTKMTADLDLPKLLTAQADQAARKIYKGFRRRRNVIYVLPIWRYIMFIIKNIPEFIFKRMKL